MAETVEKNIISLDIDGITYNIKDDYIRKIVDSLITTIKTNNQSLTSRINDLNTRIENLESQLSNQGS